MGEVRAREDRSTEDEQETRPNHSALFKAKVAMDTLRDGQTIAEVDENRFGHFLTRSVVVVVKRPNA